MNPRARWYAIPTRRNGLTPFSAADLERFFGTIPTPGPTTSTASSAAWHPPMELVEHEDRYVMTLEVPGLTIHDVDVEVEDDVVRVRGTRPTPAADENTETAPEVRLLVAERPAGSFERAVQLPSPVVEGKARASLKDGLLVVELPRQEKPRAKKLTIQVAD